MSELNNNQVPEQKAENNGAAVQNPAPQQAPVAQAAATQPTQQKEGLGAKIKKHWKGIAIGATGILAAGASVFTAYKKGKQVGINSIPYPQQPEEDYSLNPNE